jgi:hypothetical protein
VVKLRESSGEILDMIPKTRGHNEFFKPMQISVKTWISSSTEARPTTATLPARAPVVEISGFKKAKLEPI